MFGVIGELIGVAWSTPGATYAQTEFARQVVDN
jgi:hypothetical protein